MKNKSDWQGLLSRVVGHDDSSQAAWAETIDELHDMRNLKDGWDGLGSPAPPKRLVNGAIRLAKRLQAAGYRAPARATPSVNGKIILEWYTPEGYTELEIVSSAAGELLHLPNAVPITYQVRF